MEVEREVEGLARTLPEVLVEKIISRMPFPSILNARGLSKSWLSRFSPLSSQLGDEEKKRAATCFQALVCERSQAWESFFPLCITQQSIFAYHHASRKWLKLPSFLPDVFFKTRPNLWMSGALLFTVDWSTRTTYAANIFTRSWRKLPTLRNARQVGPTIFPMSLWDTSLATYKVIVLENISENRLSVRRYEPKSDVWVESLLECGLDGFWHGACHTYLNGIVYSALGEASGRHRFRLEAFDVEKGTLEELHLASSVYIEGHDICLVVYNAQLLMILKQGYQFWQGYGNPHVLKIDLTSRGISEVGRAPPTIDGVDYEEAHNRRAACVGPNIFFPAGGQMVAYNLEENEWSSSEVSPLSDAIFRSEECTSCYFQPGLNPFAEV